MFRRVTKILLLIITTVFLFTASALAQTKILAFGDSLVAGYGVPKAHSLPHQLRALLYKNGYETLMYNYGVSGNTTEDAKNRIAQTILKTNPDIAIIVLGGNDLLRDIKTDTTYKNLDAILNYIYQKSIKIVLVGIEPPPNSAPQKAAYYKAMYTNLATKYRAKLYPFILDKIYLHRELMLGDKIHPNGRGYSYIARQLAPMVEAYIEEIKPTNIPDMDLPAPPSDEELIKEANDKIKKQKALTNTTNETKKDKNGSPLIDLLIE